MTFLDTWLRWKDSVGATRARLLQEMVVSQEPLVQTFARDFLQSTRYYVEHLRDDIYQAARIGVIRALDKWDPKKGEFSTICYWWQLHEMQQVVRHATPVSRPKSADLPRAKQEAVAAFFARYGRYPDPEEVGISPAAALRSLRASATFVGEAEIVEIADERDPDDGPEAALDSVRDMRSLRRYLKKLTPTETKDFWRGRRPDLQEAAKQYVESSRDIRER
jgi:RNA polymerase sigma factor (sigma-70 family)